MDDIKNADGDPLSIFDHGTGGIQYETNLRILLRIEGYGILMLLAPSSVNSFLVAEGEVIETWCFQYQNRDVELNEVTVWFRKDFD